MLVESNEPKIYQLDLFKDPEISRLEAEILENRVRSDRVRKGIFARFNRLQKEYDELKEDHEIMKRYICRGEVDVQ